MLVIDPDECIDCAVCVPECPVNAIYAGEDVPEAQQPLVALNAQLAKSWPAITRSVTPPADADAWSKQAGKLAFLDRGTAAPGAV